LHVTDGGSTFSSKPSVDVNVHFPLSSPSGPTFLHMFCAASSCVCGFISAPTFWSLGDVCGAQSFKLGKTIYNWDFVRDFTEHWQRAERLYWRPRGFGLGTSGSNRSQHPQGLHEVSQRQSWTTSWSILTLLTCLISHLLLSFDPLKELARVK